MKKLILTALVLSCQMHAMQMRDLISNNIHNKEKPARRSVTKAGSCSDTCCSTAAKVLCLGTLLLSGQVQGRLEAGNVAAGHAVDTALDGPGVGGIAGMCSNLGTAFIVAGVSEDRHPSNNLIIVAAVSPGVISKCLADVYSKHSLRPFCEAGTQCYDRDVAKTKEKKD